MPEVNRLGEPILGGKEKDSILRGGSSQAASGSKVQCKREMGAGPGGQGWGQGFLSLENGWVCGLGARGGH